MDIIYEYVNKTCMTIYGETHYNYFGKVKPFSDEFLEQWKSNLNVPHDIPFDVKNKIKAIALEDFFIHMFPLSIFRLRKEEG